MSLVKQLATAMAGPLVRAQALLYPHDYHNITRCRSRGRTLDRHIVTSHLCSSCTVPLSVNLSLITRFPPSLYPSDVTLL